MAKLREELDKAVLEMEAAHKARVATKASLCDRPPPVLLPSEDDSRRAWLINAAPLAGEEDRRLTRCFCCRAGESLAR